MRMEAFSGLLGIVMVVQMVCLVDHESKSYIQRTRIIAQQVLEVSLLLLDSMLVMEQTL